MSWTTLTLEITTPLFNGGAHVDDDFGQDDGTAVRVPSLRGAMRFWFRALAGAVTGPNLRVLADLESAVFGRSASGRRDDRAASPLRMRIPAQPELSWEERPDFLDKWIGYLLGLGLTEWEKGKGMILTRPYAPAGQRFPLMLQFGDDERTAALALASLWLLCTYGGLGARVRRGFGGLRIVSAEGWLPPPWDHESIRSPDLDFYGPHLWPSGPLEGCMRHLKSLADERNATLALDPWTGPPSFPVFSRRYTLAGLSGGAFFTDWADVLCYAGEQLRYFRASREYPYANYEPKIKTPEWEEVVHGDDDRFPVGALGLPVVYNKGYAVNAYNSASEIRRASPLWLRPVGSGQEWRLLSFAFLSSFLPDSDDLQVKVRKGAWMKPVIVDDRDVAQLANQWIETTANDEWFEPGDRVYPPEYY